MKVAILAGGLGTRLSEETTLKLKPMAAIGSKLMLWHIMNVYAAYGYKEFVVAPGYKGEITKDYFLNYHSRVHNLIVKLHTGEGSIHNGSSEDWVAPLLDTGTEIQTGGRVKQMTQFIGLKDICGV